MTPEPSETLAHPLDICLVCRSFFPSYSGPGERFRRYGPGLRARGIKMRVFSVAWLEHAEKFELTGIRSKVDVGAMASPTEVDGVRVDRVLLSREMGQKQMMSTYFSALSRYVKHASRRPDIIHFLTLKPQALPCLAYLKFHKIPLVHTNTMVRDPSVGALKNFLASLPLRFMDRIVVSSGVMRESLRKLGIRNSVDVIPNGVDLERFRPPSSPDEVMELRGELGLPPSGALVTFVGGCMEERKGVDLLAEAWQEIACRHPEAWLLLVGPGPEDIRPSPPQERFLKRIQGLLDQSGARDRVVFTGRVDNVEAYLQASDVFVFPSRREGMPNVVPEAFGCGVASVLTPFEGFPDEFGNPGTHFLLAEHDPEDITRCVVMLIEDSDCRRRIGAAGRRWVEEHHSLQESLDRYVAVYRNLAPHYGH